MGKFFWVRALKGSWRFIAMTGMVWIEEMSEGLFIAGRVRKSGIREQFVLEVKDAGKRRIIYVDKEFVADEMEFKFFNSILDCQNLFVDHMVVLFRVFELSACMGTEMTHAIDVFKENGTPIIIAGISLEDALSTCGNSEWRRLILTLHGRKGLPVTTRIALLDTRFKQYQHVVIGTVLTTVHAGSVLLTFYPNFNLSLKDPNLPTTIKVQIQLQGAEQTPTSKLATLHHQIVYRLQNHALDLPTPYTTSDALMIFVDTYTIPTIIQIPKQIQKQELLKLMPLEWLTNYEYFHQNSEPVKQQKPHTPRLSYTAMITAVQTVQEKKLPIHGFSSEGYLVYPDKINEYADITSILMATKTEDPSTSTSTPIVEDSSSNDEHKASHTEPVSPMPPPAHDHSTKPSSASWFTFDDIPRHKWPARLQEFAAWIDLQGTKPNAQSQVVLREFMARSTDVESNFSEQSEQDDQTAFIITESSDSEDISVISTVQNVNHVSTIPRPSLKMSILLSKFHKPVLVIGFLDTRADTSMVDPSVLPSDYWEPHSKLFRAVNGETFKTTLITKKPIGFNILHLVKNLFLTSSGIRYKQMFLPYTDTLRLYALSKTPSPYSHISQKFLEYCPENHSQFHHPSPLWKNEQFFIHLPFKLNEDINPTKASHAGMSPSDLLLAMQECSPLLQQGLIEPTDSDWACQAFYVEKRSELVCGKKRLVIDYQPLNSFLKDDKFLLPKIQTLFVHLQGARIFSKFDLKAGFWQLGISPVDRHKTAFCIPDAHYQWTVMPFGLKVAPSLFQKAMTKIFNLILYHALVYIDDILLFASDHESHQKLLLDFFSIVQAHGIMLSAKKSSLGKESIDFLGMLIKDGQYQPGPHIVTELLKFPATNLTKKQIQQFLGIVNYVRDFIPKVAIHTSQLSRMLKKQCPPWGPAQTEAVKQLKVIAQSPPPLRIPTTGQRILQTDASDDYWSAILLEEINGVRHFCAHASGQFKDSEKNYHVIYKEILAVKYGIKKFKFHLLSHKFLINMDNSSFPRIFDFKNKLLPDKQLLSLKNWFAKYDFTVQHIKGNQNLIPDFLTRPVINKPSLISSIQTIPVIAMTRQLPFKALTQRTFPMNFSFQLAYQLQDFAVLLQAFL
ncbi:hypothetical protein KPL71_014610 [Citrus sinensis]|uniref:Uncharacterized protein n=1 Tax=Citrus sinensis TaxID=2711 RepID=A0ACB8KD17_CITSI|nr:hypothetical protein KPL71_014610 [Citrus sinensis]